MEIRDIDMFQPFLETGRAESKFPLKYVCAYTKGLA